MNNLTQGSVSKAILKFMIPVLLSNLLQLTYNIADTRIVGTFLGDKALAAVGSTTVLNSLFVGFFLGISNGFAITISQLFGAKSLKSVRKAFAASFVLGISIAVILISSTLILLHPIMVFLNVPADLMGTAGSYIKIILVGMLVTMLYDIFLASARAIGDSVTPLLILVVSVVLNILWDILLLGVFHIGVWGAAMATVGAQFVALVICVFYLLRKYEFFNIRVSDLKHLNSSMVKEMLATGFSMGFMNSLISIGSLILQTAINSLGASYIVAQSAARRVSEATMSVFIAMGHTLATYCGQNYGAGKYQRIRQGVCFAHWFTSAWCIVVLLGVYLFSPAMIYMITGSNDQVMIAAAVRYLKIDTLLYLVVAVIFVQRNALQGIGDRITPLISSGIEMLGKIVLTYTIVPVLGYLGVILVEPIVWVFMVIPLTIKINHVMRSPEWEN